MRLPLCAAVLLLIIASVNPSPAGSSLAEAIEDGDVNLDLRYRFERVDQETFADDAKASTLRMRLGYETGSYHDFRAFAEFEGSVEIGDDAYNSTANGRSNFPVVADPVDAEVNQLYLSYSGLNWADVKLGRQRIALDNHRFVGPVGWRQNEQTFDALTLRSKELDNVTVFYSHLNNANRIFGENHPDPARADLDLSTDLLNVAYDTSAGKLTGYAYFLELVDAPLASHRNLGLRFAGKHKWNDDWTMTYLGEFADQSDFKDGASSVDADYFRGELGAIFGRMSGKVGIESLGGDGTYGFSTPLATLHAFNGWADVFLSATPANGLEDTFFQIGGLAWGVKLTGIYHDFGADEGGADYGSEIDLQASRKINDRLSVALKYADYDADTFGVDVEKLWFTVRFAL